jgi:serine/threonine protein kinase
MRTKDAVLKGFNKMATDMWAFAATMFEGCTDQKAIDKADVLSVLEFGYTAGLDKLLNDLLISDPKKRPTSTGVLEHPMLDLKESRNFKKKPTNNIINYFIFLKFLNFYGHARNSYN